MNFSRIVCSDFLEELIEKYKTHRCLWDMKDTNYHNNREKAIAYKDLLDFYKQADPNATIEVVKSKIANMRGHFRRELKKVMLSKRKGDSTLYEPTIWYYHLMLFLTDNMNITKIEKLIEGNKNYQEESSDNITTCDNIQDEGEWENPVDEGTKSWETSALKRPHCKRRANYDSDEEFEAVAKNVKQKLKRMNTKQRGYAEILINHAMVYGVGNRLTEKSIITPINSDMKSSNDESD